MAALTPAAKAITDLEQRIAKLHLALEKARTQELASAEKALLSAQKNAASAAKKLAELNGKTIRGPKSAATSAREKLLKKDAEGSAKALVAAQAAFDNLSSAYAEAAYIADEVAALLNSPAKKAAKAKAAKPAKAEKPAKAQKPGKVAKQAAKAQKAEAKKIAPKNIELQQPDAKKRDKAAAKKAPKAEVKSGKDKTTGDLSTAKNHKAPARKTQTAAKKKAAAQKAVAPLEDAGSAVAALSEIAAQSQETPAVPVSAPSAGDTLVSNLASNTEAAIAHTTPETSDIKSSEIAPVANASAADAPLPGDSATV